MLSTLPYFSDCPAFDLDTLRGILDSELSVLSAQSVFHQHVPDPPLWGLTNTYGDRSFSALDTSTLYSPRTIKHNLSVL